MRYYLGQDPTSSDAEAAKPSVLNLTARLRATNTDLIALETEARNDPIVAQALAYDLPKLRQQQNDAAAKLTTVYAAIFGTVPTGLNGLGAFPIIAWVGIVAAIAAAVFLIEQGISVAKTKADAARQTAQNQGTQLNLATNAQGNLNDALIRGDTSAADYWKGILSQSLTQAGATGGTDFGKWFQDNWGLLAAVAVGVLAVPRLMD